MAVPALADRGRGRSGDDGREHELNDDSRSRSSSVTPAAPAGGAAAAPAVAAVAFSTVQPIFAKDCVSCHGGTSGLHLDTAAKVRAGSDSGPVVIPGDPAGSLLVKHLTGAAKPRMPLGQKPLAAKDVDAIRAWIQAGAGD